MEDKVILLVEDNADDELLTLRALKKNNIRNDVVVARDGNEALDYLFGTGVHSGRDLSVMPQIILLDLKLPKVDGFEVLNRVRASEITKFLPVVSPRPMKIRIASVATIWVPTALCGSRSNLKNSLRP